MKPQVTAPRAEAPGLQEIAAPISSHKGDTGGVWPTDALVCADSQVGSFRRTSAPHDRERFTWQRVLCQNTIRLVVKEPVGELSHFPVGKCLSL